MNKKPRSDSKLDALPESRQLELRDHLLGGMRYDDVLSWLAVDCGVQSSLASLSGFFKRHCAPVMKERRQIAALKAETLVEEAGKTDWTTATLELVKQTAFELMAQEQVDAKSAEKFLKLVLKAKGQSMDERKLRLLENKAKAADEAAALMQKLKDGGERLPEDERAAILAAVDDALGVKAK